MRNLTNPDRKITPENKKVAELLLNEPTKITLSNGMEMFLIESGLEDVVRIDIVVNAGSAFQDKPLCASFTNSLLKEGTEVVSSNRLSEICNINAAIIRKDLSYFGEFGKRGIGYNVQNLLDTVRGILKMEDIKKVALIGVGNIGTAILSYP